MEQSRTIEDYILLINYRHVLSRILIGTLYGTAAGLLSGISVHIPILFMQQKHGLLGSGNKAVLIGAVFAVIIGTFGGFSIACFIDLLQRRIVTEKITHC
jgi:hypothetical protein